MRTDTAKQTPAASTQRPAYAVRNSRIHGKGVFATRKVAAGTRIIEYTGERITSLQAAKRHGQEGKDPHHTFFFSLQSGRVIDGASGGNEARWINHACAPNCEALEEKGHVYIYALRDIRRGEELSYDYKLFIEERYTPALKRAFACHCGAPNCRQTMLVPKPRTAKKK